MTAPRTVLFWFRRDLRLHDHGALAAALGSGTTHLVPVHCQPPAGETTPWGFARRGLHRRAFEGAALRDLAAGMARLGNPLLQCQGQPATVLPALARAVGATTVVCEEIAAPMSRPRWLPCAQSACRCRPCGTAACCSRAICPGPWATCLACSPPFGRRWSRPASSHRSRCRRLRPCCRGPQR